ncbi:MAG: hypothetical protein Q4F18_06515, partial [Clostridia bacterium]|nr:hypothetical protein [Clostridia bacterium]
AISYNSKTAFWRAFPQGWTHARPHAIGFLGSLNRAECSAALSTKKRGCQDHSKHSKKAVF